MDSALPMLMPGEHGDIRITLLNKMVMDVGQPFTIRENDRTVATGLITEILKNINISKNNLSKIEIPDTS